jgi:hypothetical protein
MADSLENKNSLAERLEADRQQMAIRVTELQREYNVTDRLKESVQKHPWQYIIGGVLIGFLLSRLPARRKEVYVWENRRSRRMPKDELPTRLDKENSGKINKLWSLAKPIISAYIGRELYKPLRRWGKKAAEVSRASE